MRLVIFPILFLFAYCSNGQNNYDELLHISYNKVSPSKFTGTNITLNQQQFNLKGGYGFILNDKEDILNIGGGYQYLELKHDFQPLEPLEIHNIGIGTEWIKKWKNPYWGSTISLGIAGISDYKTETTTAYQTAFSGMVHYGKSNDLIWTFGLFYSDQPFGPWLFPLIGLDWRISDKLYFSSLLFSNTYLEYKVKQDKWYTGIDITAQGMSFVISGYNGFQDSYITSFSESFPYYPFSITIFNDFYVKKYYSLFAKVGYLVSRENVHYSREHNIIEESLYNKRIQSSLIINLGIALRMRKFN